MRSSVMRLEGSRSTERLRADSGKQTPHYTSDGEGTITLTFHLAKNASACARRAAAPRPLPRARAEPDTIEPEIDGPVHG
jgi:hypothetical protein